MFTISFFPTYFFVPRELSFEKGDFVDLTHLVDDNWLEGSVKGKTGYFPHHMSRWVLAVYKNGMVDREQ